LKANITLKTLSWPEFAVKLLLNLYYPCMKQIRCERVGAKKKRTYDQAKTPFQRLLEQPIEDMFEKRRVKTAALALGGWPQSVEVRSLHRRSIGGLEFYFEAWPLLG
jgi:hypothetical protein